MRQLRREVKALRLAVRHGDAEAARALLAHSVAVRHDRLSMRRYFVARALGSEDLDGFRRFALAASRRLPPGAILALARDATSHLGKQNEIHLMASELLPTLTPLILPFDGIWPQFAGAPRLCGPQTSVLGRATIGERLTLGPGAVIRADGHFVDIGNDFQLGEMSTVHIAHELFPTRAGHGVTVGRNAVVHACTIGDNCVVEDDAVILDGSVLEDDVVVEAGAIVFPRSKLQNGFVYAGSPATAVRRLEPGERERRALLLREAVAASLFSAEAPAQGRADRIRADVFVARTARLAGRIEAGAQSSIYFGCRLDARQAAITIGERSNVQDNTRIDAADGDVVIGRDTTIGHNVHIRACRIGENALIGIGSDLGAGTIVDAGVLLAGGSTTAPRQHLEGGWLWGGRPARPIAALKDAKRGQMRATIEIYCGYSAAYRAAQDIEDSRDEPRQG